MTPDYIAGGLVGLGMMVYLVYILLHPEKL
jgi:K+-transporting ATPase KdpF subunit